MGLLAAMQFSDSTSDVASLEIDNPEIIRGEDRQDVFLPSRAELAGVVFDCVITGISLSGMRLSAPGAAACRGQQIVVIPPAGDPICGIIRWCRDNSLGIKFYFRIAADTMLRLRATGDREPRARPGRACIEVEALAAMQNTVTPVRVLNISVGGLMFRTQGQCKPGQALRLEFDLIRSVSGHVRWSKGGRSGLVFTRLLPIESAHKLAAHFGTSREWTDEVERCHFVSDGVG